MKRSFLICLMLLLAPTLLNAGVEPFYKGEWGMSQQELEAIYGTPPAVKDVFRQNKTAYMEYPATILGQTVTAQYHFGRNDQLHKVLIDLVTPKIPGPEAMAFINEIGALIAASETPFEHCQLTPDPGKKADMYIGQWINAVTFIDIVAPVTAKPKAHLIYLRFSDNRDDHFRQFFDELKTKVKAKE